MPIRRRRARSRPANALVGRAEDQPADLLARSPTRWPRTRRSPTAGAASRTSPTARHLSNRVEREVVDALVAAVQAMPIRASRTVTTGSRRNGSAWREHAALGPQRAAARCAVDAHWSSWDEARKTVLDAYAGFSPKMAGIAQRFFDDRWIDAPTRPGKAPGAFAHPTVPSAHPYVLLNYQGKPRDVMTLAHELGHGVHQVLAGPQGALMALDAADAGRDGERVRRDADLPRAAVAQTTSVDERRVMLAGKVEDMINTVVRQVAFYTFERKLHTRAARGRTHRRRRSRAIWMSVQAESLGPAIRLDAGLRDLYGPTSRTSSTRRSTSMPTRSAIAS